VKLLREDKMSYMVNSKPMETNNDQERRGEGSVVYR